MSDSPSCSSRLETEVALLEAMYPGQTSFDSQSREFAYYSDGAVCLCLRLPAAYPEAGFPDVILAADATKNDLRAQTTTAVRELRLAEGDEALDAILAAFQQIVQATTPDQEVAPAGQSPSTLHSPQKSKTVIIWLHHLLNTNKRKLALSPPTSSPTVRGLTKPGYPGVLVFSSPASAVSDHVSTLRAQNWQAFQVRYEDDQAWLFAHDVGVIEVESMSDMVKGLGDLPKGIKNGDKQKAEFLKAVGIK